MTTLASQADAAYALMMTLAEHGDMPQPEFELYDYETDTGASDWGVSLVVRDLALFEQWRAALDLAPDDITYRACHHGACLVAVGEARGVPVELFAVADVPAK
ncbi:hypothetical protein [Kitasatospora purpeofusca]|uniref:hypothetical protein n=1 Tax=Kitasatospora purpeofusca TaxID=67352 RepID=UPI0022533E1B|nr:hypothetical protein [Kitasatospora purpeofusca]MCX4686940.1 hypothetical protein [Kitasatospora purpeofusca]